MHVKYEVDEKEEEETKPKEYDQIMIVYQTFFVLMEQLALCFEYFFVCNILENQPYI